MNFKKSLRRLTGEKENGLERRICCYFRYSVIFATSIQFMRMRFIKESSRKEAKSIYYLFAQKGKVKNLFNALTLTKENLTEIEIKSKFFRIFDKD